MKKYYLIERHNPQFDKPYYMKKGKLFKKEVHKYRSPVYGTNIVLSYETESAYNEAIERLEKDGFKVHD